MRYLVDYEGESILVEVDKRGGSTASVIWEGRSIEVDLALVADTGVYSLLIDGKSYLVALERVPEGVKVEGPWQRRTLRISRFLQEKGVVSRSPEEQSLFPVRSPMSGLVAVLAVKPGEGVHRGDPLLVLEAMKMRNEIKAPFSGMVREVRVKVGEPIEYGEPLLILQKY